MKEWGRVKRFVQGFSRWRVRGVGARGWRGGRRGVSASVVRIRPCVAGCSHQWTRGGEVRGVGRLGCRGMYPRRFTRMMGSLATARLGSIS